MQPFMRAMSGIISAGLLMLPGLGCRKVTNENIKTRVVTEEEMQQLPALPPMNSRFVPQQPPPDRSPQDR